MMIRRAVSRLLSCSRLAATRAYISAATKRSHRSALRCRMLSTESSVTPVPSIGKDIFEKARQLSPLKRRILLLSLAGFGLAYKAIYQVPAGHVGIVDLFGKVNDQPLEPGLHILNPLVRVHKMSVRTQVLHTAATVPSKEGLIVHLEVNALYRLDPAQVVQLFKTVGPNYEEVIIMPHLKSSIRQLTSAHEAKALYTADMRELIGEKLTAELKTHLDGRGIIIEDTPLRELVLPEKLREAIEEKLRAEQESQRMQFVLQKEQGEAERKKIEALGIAEFQRIVAEGISENLLRWKAIGATEQLAKSNNTKVVVIGNGKDGMPVILSADYSDSQTVPHKKR